jgi:hypothetical protein
MVRRAGQDLAVSALTHIALASDFCTDVGRADLLCCCRNRDAERFCGLVCCLWCVGGFGAFDFVSVGYDGVAGQ